MDITLIEGYIQRIERSLADDFGAHGNGLAELAGSIAPELPDDLKALLLQTTARHAGTPGGALPEDAALAFTFDCGRLLERLDQFRRARAADTLVFIDSDGRAFGDPERADLDRLSRFIVLRDRLLRKAADFSLKVLVTAVVLLVVGFALGLI